MYKRRKVIGTYACLCTPSWMFPTLMHSNFSFLFATCVWPGTTTGGLGKQRFCKIPMTTQQSALFYLGCKTIPGQRLAWRGKGGLRRRWQRRERDTLLLFLLLFICPCLEGLRRFLRDNSLVLLDRLLFNALRNLTFLRNSNKHQKMLFYFFKKDI